MDHEEKIFNIVSELGILSLQNNAPSPKGRRASKLNIPKGKFDLDVFIKHNKNTMSRVAFQNRINLMVQQKSIKLVEIQDTMGRPKRIYKKI